jgi:hypothetical protein
MTPGYVVWTVVAELGWAIAIAVGMTRFQPEARPVRDRSTVTRGVVLPLAIAGVAYIAWGLVEKLSAPLADGLLGGLPGGFFWGLALRAPKPPSTDASAHGLSG